MTLTHLCYFYLLFFPPPGLIHYLTQAISLHLPPHYLLLFFLPLLLFLLLYLPNISEEGELTLPIITSDKVTSIMA